jgi:hypothetical protein
VETEIRKIKDDSKIKGKQTSIAAVKDQFLAFATFPTPLLSRYRLPLKDICWGKSFHVVFCTCGAWGLGFYFLSGISVIGCGHCAVKSMSVVIIIRSITIRDTEIWEKGID